MDEFAAVFIQYQDHLAPTLDVYEQAIYVFLLRQTQLEGKRKAVIGFKSARKKLGYGIGKAGTPPSEGVVYEKLRSLEAKGCIQLQGSERAGTRIALKLPSEIPGLLPATSSAQAVSLEDMDFFGVVENRAFILKRDGWQCFYCLAKLDENRRASSYLSPPSCSHRLNISSARGRCDDGVAFRVEGDRCDVRPVACVA